MVTLSSVSARYLRSAVVTTVLFLLSGLLTCTSSGQTSSGGTSPEASRPDINAERIQEKVHARINELRAERELERLEYNRSLQSLAQAHSADMARRDFFGHENPDGEGVNDRARQLDLTCEKQLDEERTAHGFGENLFTGTLYRGYREIYEGDNMVRREYDWKDEASIAQGIVDGWMDSPGHRANILEPRYETEAISIVIDGETYYVTQVFC